MRFRISSADAAALSTLGLTRRAGTCLPLAEHPLLGLKSSTLLMHICSSSDATHPGPHPFFLFKWSFHPRSLSHHGREHWGLPKSQMAHLRALRQWGLRAGDERGSTHKQKPDGTRSVAQCVWVSPSAPSGSRETIRHPRCHLESSGPPLARDKMQLLCPLVVEKDHYYVAKAKRGKKQTKERHRCPRGECEQPQRGCQPKGDPSSLGGRSARRSCAFGEGGLPFAMSRCFLRACVWLNTTTSWAYRIPCYIPCSHWPTPPSASEHPLAMVCHASQPAIVFFSCLKLQVPLLE